MFRISFIGDAASMWLFKSRKAKQKAETKRDNENQEKILISQRALLDAATSTADAAHDVTNILKGRLEDSIRQLETTARILNDALIVCEIDGTIQSFNPAAERMFGYDYNDIIGESLTKLFNPSIEAVSDLWLGLESKNAKTLSDAPLAHVQGRKKNKDTFPINASVARLDRYDNTTIVLILIRDLSENVQTTEICDYRTAFDNNIDGILIIQNLKIVAANPSVSRLFGYNVTEILDEPFNFLLSKEDRKTLTNRKIAKISKSSTPEQFRVDGVHENGSHIPLLFATTKISWKGETACLVTIKDVTSLRKFNDILPTRRENQIEMICCYDDEFSITFANDAFAKKYGLTKRTIIGKDYLSLMTGNEKEVFLLHIKSINSDQPSRRIHLQSNNDDGSVSFTDWIDHASYDEDGNVIEYQRTGRDISMVVNDLLSNK